MAKVLITARNIRQVLSFVRGQCRFNNVKFTVRRCNGLTLGEFSEYDRELTLYRYYRRVKGRRRGKRRTAKNMPWEMLITALHELVHMFQWKRRDPNWNRMYDRNTRYGDVIIEYADGDKWYPRNVLIESARIAAQLEFEADVMAGSILSMFGIPYGGHARHIRNAKSYAYSYLILAHTGIMPSYRVKRKWHKLFSSSPTFDVTHDVFARMAEMTREGVDSAVTVWDNKKLVVQYSKKVVDK